MRTEAEVSLEVLMYNERLSSWEPILEPVMERENVYRPWEILVKVSLFGCDKQKFHI